MGNLISAAHQRWHGGSQEEREALRPTLHIRSADAMVQMEEGRGNTYERISSAINNLPIKVLPVSFVGAATQISRLPIQRMDEVIQAVRSKILLNVYANEADRRELRIGKLRKSLAAWFDGISLAAAISGSFAALLAFESLHLTFWKLVMIIGGGCSALFALATYFKLNNIKIIQKAWLLTFGAYNVAVEITDKLIETEMLLLEREIRNYNQLEEQFNTATGRSLIDAVRLYEDRFELPFVQQPFADSERWRRNTIFGDRLTRYFANASYVERLSDLICPIPVINWEQGPNRALHRSLNIEVSNVTTWYKRFREITPLLGIVGMLGVTMAYWGGTSALKQTYDGDSSAWKTPHALIGTMSCLVCLAAGYWTFNKIESNKIKESQDKVSNRKHLYGEEKDMLSSLRGARAFMQTLLRYAERITPPIEDDNNDAPDDNSGSKIRRLNRR